MLPKGQTQFSWLLSQIPTSFRLKDFLRLPALIHLSTVSSIDLFPFTSEVIFCWFWTWLPLARRSSVEEMVLNRPYTTHNSGGLWWTTLHPSRLQSQLCSAIPAMEAIPNLWALLSASPEPFAISTMLLKCGTQNCRQHSSCRCTRSLYCCIAMFVPYFFPISS